MPAPKGHRIPNAPRGRSGPNKLTKSVKAAFEAVFNDLQKDPKKPFALAKWAESEPTEFYKLAAKLIPAEINGKLSGNVTLTPNINLVVEQMAPSRITIETDPVGVNGRKPD